MTCMQVQKLIELADDYDAVLAKLWKFSSEQIEDIGSHQFDECKCFGGATGSGSKQEHRYSNMAIAIAVALRNKRIGSSRGRPVATIGVPGLA